MFNQTNYATATLVPTATLNNNNNNSSTNANNNSVTVQSAEPNERGDNLRILQTLNVQIQSMALKLDQILTQTEEVTKKLIRKPTFL